MDPELDQMRIECILGFSMKRRLNAGVENMKNASEAEGDNVNYKHEMRS